MFERSVAGNVRFLVNVAGRYYCQSRRSLSTKIAGELPAFPDCSLKRFNALSSLRNVSSRSRPGKTHTFSCIIGSNVLQRVARGITQSRGSSEIVMRKTPDFTDKHVGARVRMRRMMLHMSQSALGEGLGLTFQQIQKYEKGTNRISASRLQQLSGILDVPVHFFFEGVPGGGKGYKTSSPDHIFECLGTADGLALVGAFTRIPDAALRRTIVRMVEAIAAKCS